MFKTFFGVRAYVQRNHSMVVVWVSMSGNTYTYYDNGWSHTRVDSLGHTTTYTYDDVGREENRQYHDATAVSFTYDAVGNRETMSDVTGVTTYTYDDIDRIKTIENPDNKKITYTYDAASQRKTMVDPNVGLTSYDYDDAGRLERIENPQSEVTTLMYDAAGRETETQLASGTRNETDYNPANHLTARRSVDSGNTTLINYGYALDRLGYKTSVAASHNQSSNWGYDNIYQQIYDYYMPLTTGQSWSTTTLAQWDAFTLATWDSISLNSSSIQSDSSAFEYDLAGNRLIQVDPVTLDITTFVYDHANRLLTATDVNGTTTYTYDANGNRLTIEEPTLDVTTNTWDPENRLVLVEGPGGATTEYAYNGDGLRVEKIVDGIDSTKFIYDGNNVLQETDDVGTLVGEFTDTPEQYGRVISQHRSPDTSFYHFDGTENVRSLTDDSESITDEYEYEAFGNERSSTGSTANSQRWKGRYLAYYRDPDASPEPQYAMHHRSYDPSTGTFVSKDPAEDDSNLYRYVRNNPINREDPSGLFDWDTVAGALDVVSNGLSFLKGIVYGVFVDEIWGGASGIASLSWSAAKLSASQAEYYFYKATFQSERAAETEYGKFLAKSASLLEAASDNPTLHALLKDFHSPLGLSDGFEPETKAFLAAIAPEVTKISGVLAAHVKNMDNDTRAFHLGRIVGAVLVMVATGGGAVALKVGRAGKFAKLTKVLDDIGISGKNAEKIIEAVNGIIAKLKAPNRIADFTESASRIPGAQWKNFDQLRAYLARQTHFSDEGVGLIKSGDSILDAMGAGKNAAFTFRNGKPYIVLRSGATNREVLHELGHMLTHKHLGNDVYYALSKSAREHLASTFVRSRGSFSKMTPDEIWQELKAIDPNFVPSDAIRDLLRQWGALLE